MNFAIIFLLELFALFFLSRMVTRRLSSLIYSLTRSQKATIYSMALLFFPGTIIHELSHMLMAGLLFVHVGHIELWPKLEGHHVKLGSVAVARTDVFRRFLIGAAPFIFGASLLLGLLFFAAQNNLFSNQLYILLLIYAVFEIGNTMFSSNKDMEGALELFGALAFVGIVLYFLGIRLSLGIFEGFFSQPLIIEVFKQGGKFLLAPLGIDMLLLVVLKLITLKKRV